MKYKKIIVLAIFLVSLLAVSAVSAADNATSDVVSVEETTDGVVSMDNATYDIVEFDEKIDEINVGENNENLSHFGENLDDVSISLYDDYYQYDSKGYDISTIIEDITFLDDANYHMNLQMYDKNKKLVLDTTSKVAKKYEYGSAPTFRVKLPGGDYTAILTMSMNSNHYGSHKSKSFKYSVYLESKEEFEKYAYGDDDEELVSIRINAPTVKVKLKANNYFIVTIKESNGVPVCFEDVIVKIWTGKKVKKYRLSTNSKGIIKINTKKLSLGTHKVKIYFMETDSYKSKTISSKIIVKKTTATKKTNIKKKSNIKSTTIKINGPKSYFATKKLKTGDRLQSVYSTGGQYSKGVYAEVLNYNHKIHTKILKIKFYFKNKYSGKIKTKLISKISYYNRYDGGYSGGHAKLISNYIPYMAKVWYKKI